MLETERRLHVGVGSGNPVKRRAVARVLTTATVETVPVESGVSEQPRGHAETVAGAENRARRALASGAYDYGVGIEGGVAEFEGADGLFLVMWAAATDGTQVGRAGGPSLELPGRVASRVRAGEELGPVMDDILGTDDVARKAGAAGAFTRGRLPRADALADAVAGAFAPFSCDLY
jgi:inosine/xanthosine triphosphatase